MTWGIYKKHRELRGGGIFSTLLNAISAPIKLIGKGIGNAIKPGAGDDFVKGYNSVIKAVGGGAPLQNNGSTLKYNKMIPRLDDSDSESSF